MGHKESSGKFKLSDIFKISPKPPYYPKLNNDLFIPLDLSSLRFLTTDAGQCKTFKERHNVGQLKRPLSFADLKIQQSYNNSLSSICTLGIFWCTNFTTPILLPKGPFKAQTFDEARQTCQKVINGAIWTPRTNDIGELLPDTYMRRPNELCIADRLNIWTGSVRLNESHFKREDGFIFQPRLKYYSVKYTSFILTKNMSF